MPHDALPFQLFSGEFVLRGDLVTTTQARRPKVRGRPPRDPWAEKVVDDIRVPRGKVKTKGRRTGDATKDRGPVHPKTRFSTPKGDPSMPEEARAPREPRIFLDVQMPSLTPAESSPAGRRGEKHESESLFLGTIHLTGTLAGGQKLETPRGRNSSIGPGVPRSLVEAPAPGASPSVRSMEPNRVDPEREEVFDREAALKRLDGDTALLEEVAGMFVESVPEMLHQLKESTVAGNLAAVEFTAHALKGMGASLEARAFTAEVRRMELQAREKNLQGVRETLLALERELSRLLPDLAAFAKA
jgi:HPt (histidine-containing phosphotransfer) domain-containing protein